MSGQIEFHQLLDASPDAMVVLGPDLELRALGIGYAQGHALTQPLPRTGSDGRVMMGSLQRSA